MDEAMVKEPTLEEIEREDPFAPHGLGCQCWPHVSQRAAIEASIQTATSEYREGLRTIRRLRTVEAAARAVIHSEHDRELELAMDALRSALSSEVPSDAR